MKNILNIIVFLAIVWGALAPVCAQQIAFPGAEGFGRYVTGGRGGEVYYVTNLDDSGTGSLRWAIGQSGTRTIVFKVSGTIELQSNLSIKNGDVTIAGQTAPGDGICIKNYPLMVDADNIIIRFIRARLGDAMAVENDAFGGRYRKDVIVDHCSFSWSVDETVSLYSCQNTTIQWCMITESLKNSVHDKSAHGYGAIVGGNKASYHHNLLAHHDSRSPRIGPGLQTQTTEYVDMRNNVLYNYAGEGCYGAEAMNVNIVNNYYKPGPASNTGTKRGRIIAIDKKINLASTDGFYPINNVWGKFYINGNIVDATTSSGSDITICNNATSDNWTYGVYNQIHSKYSITEAEKQSLKANTPFDSGVIETDDAQTAYDKVLKSAGCSYQRDAVDLRIITEVKNGTYTYKGSVSGQKGIIDTPSDVGGYPSLASKSAPADTDADGMPDAWETNNRLNQNDAADRNLYTLNADYTNLEVYLNSIVAHIIGDAPAVPRSPYGGIAHPIPGTIQFEHFDLGGNGVAYFDNTPGSAVTPLVDFRTDEDVDIEICKDTDGGYNVGYMATGEWMEYTVNVAATGNYNIDLRVACNSDGRTLALEMDGTVISSSIAIPNTAGWQMYQTVTLTNVPLTAGEQVMKITMGATQYVNLNHVTFKAVPVQKKQSINLVKGWNLISINVHPTDSTIATLFNGLDVAEIKDMNTYWRKDQPSFINLLQTITAGNGYLVLMNAAGTLTVVGTQNLQGFKNLEGLTTGWQLIGCPYPTATPIAGVLGSSVSEVKNFDGFWMPNGTANSIEKIDPGKGYFIKK